MDDIDEVNQLLGQTSQLNRKNVPPPLFLHAVGSPGHELDIPSPQFSSGSANGTTNLPYLKGSPDAETNSELEDLSDEGYAPRSAAEEKRVGAVFDSLDLGLNVSDHIKAYIFNFGSLD